MPHLPAATGSPNPRLATDCLSGRPLGRRLVGLQTYHETFWQLEGGIIAGCLSVGLGLLLAFGVGALYAFDASRLVLTEQRFRSLTLDLPLIVKAGIYQFFGGSEEEFVRARGQINLYAEIEKVETDLSTRLDRVADIVTRVFQLWDKHRGIKNYMLKAKAMLVLAGEIHPYMEDRAEMPVAADFNRVIDDLEAHLRYIIDEHTKTANATPAE